MQLQVDKVHTVFPNLFPEHEKVANIVMLSLVAVGISLLAIFAFQVFFRIDKYKVIENEPLVFDNNFLKEFKENYKILTKKYISMIILSFALIFGGVIFTNLMVGNWVDDILIIIVSIAIYIMLYAIYMVIVNNVIVDSDKRFRKN